MENNVILFPNAKINNTPVTLEDIYQNIYELKETQVEDSMEYLQPQLFSLIHQLGFDLTLENDKPHVILMLESIRSYLLNTCGMVHPLQEVALDIFGKPDEEIKGLEDVKVILDELDEIETHISKEKETE